MDKSHFDQVYVHGFHRGHDDSAVGNYDHSVHGTTSDAAWKASGLKNGNSLKPYKLMGRDQKGKKIAPWMRTEAERKPLDRKDVGKTEITKEDEVVLEAGTFAAQTHFVPAKEFPNLDDDTKLKPYSEDEWGAHTKPNPKVPCVKCGGPTMLAKRGRSDQRTCANCGHMFVKAVKAD